MSKTNEKKWWRDFGVGPKVLETLSNCGQTFVIFDTETTGLSAELNHIIQISAIKCVIDEEYQFHEIGRLDTYINPGYKLPKQIVKITGITDEQLAKYPDEKTQWPAISNFFKDIHIVCGHNASFDMSMLGAMYKRNEEEFDPIVLDTLRMAQELHLKNEAGSHKLGALAAHFGVDYGLTFHNSMDDVIATMRLLRLFVEEYVEKRSKDSENAIHVFDAEGNAIIIDTPKIKTKIKSCWAWTGYRGMQRLYVRVKHEDRVVWMNQRRPYDWGEKDKGSIDMFDMKDIEQQVLKLYGCQTLEELSKVRESKYARC